MVGNFGRKGILYDDRDGTGCRNAFGVKKAD